ncbi:MAG: amino acid adenylation domain-containing protein [Eubacterium sp.]|nr:amino acid adenylation domain-containing protein [Eubacterium sp.]
MFDKESLVDLIHRYTGIQSEIRRDENLMKYGLDSITVMKIAGEFRKEGYRIKFADLMEKSTVDEWYDLLCAQKQRKKKSGENVPASEKADDSDLFDLTDVQYAYLVGRDDDQVMGGVDCHAYYEFKGRGIDLKRLEKAWVELHRRHKALRTAFREGKQFVKKDAYPHNYRVLDFSSLTDSAAYAKCGEVREDLSHRKLRIEEGEVSGLTICLLPGKEHLLCLDFALIVADVKSIQIMLRDLAAFYTGRIPLKSVAEWNFREYMDTMNRSRREEKETARSYWEKKTKEMPTAPVLPMAKKQEDIRRPRNTHYTAVVSADEWRTFAGKAGYEGVTAPMALLAAYAGVVNRWSGNEKFLINVPLFDRAGEYAGIEDVVGDFTTLLLTTHDFTEECSFSERVRGTQKNFIADIHHAACSGVEVQRMLQKEYPDQRTFAPVVFACNIGLDFIDDTFDQSLGSIHYMVSQTPQVWIDCQLFVRNGELHISWDVCDELFPKGMPEDMFNTYISCIRQLSRPEADWKRLPSVTENQIGKRKTAAQTVAEYPEHPGLLVDGLLKQASEHGERIALYDTVTKMEMSYQELYLRSMGLARKLKEAGAVRGDKVAIRLQRGVNQIIGIYGTLLAGCTYVPVSYNQPQIRLLKILESMQIRFAVVEEKTELTQWNGKPVTVSQGGCEEIRKNIAGMEITDVAPEDVAYVIMTSGSTGDPKGVEITHQSAWNTIRDVNHRNGICEGDNFLAVSAVDFDLSVYDIFGSAMAGACLHVLGEANAKDAENWCDTVNERRITVWNSVPILFDMILTVAEQRKEKLPLRRVMLSGDWIPGSLAKRMYRLLPEAVLVAMGGATEASIWSNECVVPKEVPANWKYIPYGYALNGQIYRILDEKGRDCPDYVTGELCIGGYGVARDYYGDDQKTGEKFWDEGGMRWYHTGDLGRFLRDGSIEFLGRMDHQVKVKGHRIELGEIEAAAVAEKGIAAAVAAVDENNGKQQIVLYYTGVQCGGEEILRSRLEKRIPSYMIPKRCIFLEEMPVTANGKINRKALPKIKPSSEDEKGKDGGYETDTERMLALIWKELLEVKEVTREDDYFELGGNSLNATKAIYRIDEKLGVKLKISQIFRNPSLWKMAGEIDRIAGGNGE